MYLIILPESRDSSLSPVKKTTLSADAKEFVPKFATQNQSVCICIFKKPTTNDSKNFDVKPPRLTA